MSSIESDKATTIPQHIGIIPDGNRRWAKSKGLPTFEGHRRGVESMRLVARAAFDRGVKYMTMYAFSAENWKRTQEEVGYLMDLFHRLMLTEFQEFADRNVRLQFIGRRDDLSKKLIKAMEELEERTAGFTAGTMTLCLNYGGEQEIADAAAAMITAGVTAGEVTPERLAKYLYAPDMPPVDLIIRSSGEHRISNFMLWRAAYSELIFVDKYWPDFTEADLDEALTEYSRRQRRFGA